MAVARHGAAAVRKRAPARDPPRLRLARLLRAAAWALAALAGLRSRWPRPAVGGAGWLAFALPSRAGTGWLSPALHFRVSDLQAVATGRDRVVRRVGLMEPPTVTRPPDVGAEVRTRRAEWTECLINDPVLDDETGGSALRVETWVFRTSDYGDFESLLKLRGGTKAVSKHTLSCRERQVDEQMRCAQCVRLLRGGLYGNLGVSVQAYPPQPEAVGCLALSKLIEMDSPSTEEDDSGDWDGSEGRQTAFCNTVNARFEKMDA